MRCPDGGGVVVCVAQGGMARRFLSHAHIYTIALRCDVAHLCVCSVCAVFYNVD